MKLILAVAILPSVAVAEPVLVGVNAPVAWSESVGISASAGLTDHQALRANFARHSPAVEDFAILVLAGGDEAGRSGETIDAGLAWVYYPRALWDGLSLEAGALYRRRDTGTYGYEEDPMSLASNELAVRGQVGWSWLLWDHASIAIAAGMSVGREYGTATDFQTKMSTSVARTDHEAEAMLRFGVAFDL